MRPEDLATPPSFIRRIWPVRLAYNARARARRVRRTHRWAEESDAALRRRIKQTLTADAEKPRQPFG